MTAAHDSLVSGVAQVLRRVQLRLPGLQLQDLTDLSFRDLDREDKVRLSGNGVLVDRGYLDVLVEQADDLVQATAALSVYVVHELVHVAQGVDYKQRVRALRQASGDEALMHLDLHADHIAVTTLTAAIPSWSLLWLKEVQCAALHDFPILAGHAAASARRKELRALSLQCGVACRRMGLAGVGDSGYVYVVYGGGSQAMLLYRDTLDHVLASVSARRREDGRLSIRVPGGRSVLGPRRSTPLGVLSRDPAAGRRGKTSAPR